MDLLATAKAVDDDAVVIESDQHATVAALVGRAAAGSVKHEPDVATDHLLGPREDESPLYGCVKDPALCKSRTATVAWLTRFVLNEGRSRIIGIRVGDVLVAVALLEMPDEGEGWMWEKMWGAVKTWGDSGLPEGLSVGLFRRFEQNRLQRQEMRQASFEGRYLYVETLAVDPEHQRQGIGTRLVKVIRSIATTLDVPCLVDVSGQRAIRFWEKNGWGVLSRYVLKLADWPPLTVNGGVTVMAMGGKEAAMGVMKAEAPIKPIESDDFDIKLPPKSKSAKY